MKNHTDVLIFQSRIGSEVSQIRFEVTIETAYADFYEKVLALASEDSREMILDFSVLREGDEKLLQMLQKAIRYKKTVKFVYTNQKNERRTHVVEPVAVIYRWYAWYLLAYSTVKNDYRIYKLLRMENAEITEQEFRGRNTNRTYKNREVCAPYISL